MGFYDETKIIDEITSYDVAQALGLNMKMRGNRYSILCPDHNDTKHGSCYLTPKGYHCFVCGHTKNILSLVMTVEGYNKKEALEFLIEDVIGGNKEDYMEEKASSSDDSEKIKLPLNAKELEFIGLVPRVVPMAILNTSSTPLEGTDEFYVKEVKTQNIEGYSEKEYQLIQKKNSFSLIELLKEDESAFHDLIMNKIEEKIETIKMWLDIFDEARDVSEESQNMYNAFKSMYNEAKKIFFKVASIDEINAFNSQNIKFSVVNEKAS